MKLWNLKEKQKAQILSFSSEMDGQYLSRIRELGFSETALIECIKRIPFGGPRVYQIGDSVFSITEDIAGKIEIEGIA